MESGGSIGCCHRNRRYGFPATCCPSLEIIARTRKRRAADKKTPAALSLEPFAKWSFLPNSALCLKFYPRNIRYMPAVKFFACLDFERKSSFCKRLNSQKNKKTGNVFDNREIASSSKELIPPCGLLVSWYSTIFFGFNLFLQVLIWVY